MFIHSRYFNFEFCRKLFSLLESNTNEASERRSVSWLLVAWIRAQSGNNQVDGLELLRQLVRRSHNCLYNNATGKQ